MTPPRPAIFLDRDGTLNVDRSYLTRAEDMQLLPDVGEALRQFKAAGFALVVVTNQSAVGRGMMTEADLRRIHEEMNRQLAEADVALDGIYYCIHAVDHPDRKPAPGMLLRAAAELHLDLQQSWMIGDSFRDIVAGQNAGCKDCVMVRTGTPLDETLFTQAKPFKVVDDLLAAARYIFDARPVR